MAEIIALNIILLLLLAGLSMAVMFVSEKRKSNKTSAELSEALKRLKKSEEIISNEDKQLKTIINSFADGLIIFDNSDRIFLINPEADRILGLSMNNVLGRSINALSNFSRAKPIADILNSGAKIVSRKEVELAKDLIIELSVSPLGPMENNAGRLVTLHDVSKEKLVERMKTEFVSLAAHQLRTPLSIIKWSMSMLKKGEFGKLDKKQNEIIESMFRNNERLISLVNGLLNITHIEEGKYIYKTEMSNMANIVDSVISSRESQIKDKKIKLTFTKPDNLPKTLIDEEKVRLVVQNLLDNAIKYSFEGGKINVFLDNDGRDIEFKIQDFGVGIPSYQKNKIFTKFFRGENAVKANMTGSGLGLFLSKNIVEAHKGLMWFNSSEKEGTNFYFTLPIKQYAE